MKYLISKTGQFLMLPFIMCGVFACELVVDIDIPPFKPSLVMNGLLKSDTSIAVSITQNRYILDDNYVFYPVENVKISLYENDQYVGDLEPDRNLENDDISGLNGLYKIDYQPKSGFTYRLEAEKAGYDPIVAVATMPQSAPEARILQTNYRITEYNDRLVTLKYELNDPKAQDFYEVRLYIPEVYVTGYYDEELEEFVESEPIEYWNEVGYSPADATLNEFEDFSNKNAFTDELFNGKTHEVSIEFSDRNIWSDDPRYDADTNTYVMEVKRISEDYYKYLQTKVAQSNLDGSGLAEPVQVFSNIEGGYGILGACQTTTLHFTLIEGEWQR